jgi:hypothetical protein
MYIDEVALNLKEKKIYKLSALRFQAAIIQLAIVPSKQLSNLLTFF